MFDCKTKLKKSVQLEQASTDTDIYRPVPKLFKYRHQYRWPISIQTIGLCCYIVVEDGV